MTTKRTELKGPLDWECCQRVDELEAENGQLRTNQQYLDDAVRNQAIRETIHKEEITRLRTALQRIHDTAAAQGDDISVQWVIAVAAAALAHVPNKCRYDN